MTHHYMPCMSLRVPVLTTTGLVCHSGYQYSSLSVLYVTACLVCNTSIRLVGYSYYQYETLSAWYVYQRTSTEIFYSGMPSRERVFHRRRTVLNIGGRGGGGDVNLYQPWFVGGHEGEAPCISKLLGAWPSCPLFLCLCFLICQPFM